MKEMTTKHGYKWMCPETMEEFVREIGEDVAFSYAMRGLKNVMSMRSASVANGKIKVFNPSLQINQHRVGLQSIMASLPVLTPDARAALLAELQKEVVV